MTDHHRLRALAEAATRGTWATGITHGRTRVWCDGWHIIAECDVSANLTAAQKQANASYTAAMGPDTAIELLDEIRDLRERLARARHMETGV